jgi:hypothetical protein
MTFMEALSSSRQSSPSRVQTERDWCGRKGPALLLGLPRSTGPNHRAVRCGRCPVPSALLSPSRSGLDGWIVQSQLFACQTLL